MKTILPTLLIITITTISTSYAQKRDYRFAVGAVTNNTARVVAFGDTCRGAFYWNTLTVSDHEGDKHIFQAGLIIHDTATKTWVYELYDMKPNTPYGILIPYTDTVVRDTIVTSAKGPQGKYQWWKENFVYNGRTYTAKHFDKMMKAKARLTYVPMKPEEDEH